MKQYKRIDIEDRMSTPYKFMIWCVFLFVVLPLTMVASVFSVDEIAPFTYPLDALNTVSGGMFITTNYDININSITKDSVNTATDCDIWDGTGDIKGTLLKSGTFSGNVCTFSTPLSVSSNSKILITTDSNGASFYTVFSSLLSYPENSLYINWVNGWNGGSLITNRAYDIYSINLDLNSTISNNALDYYDTNNTIYDINSTQIANFYEYLYTGNVSSYPTKNDGTINGKTFNDGTLTNFADTTRVNHTGYDKALEFDGVDDTIITTLTSNTPFTTGNGFTMSAWINPKAYGEGNEGRIIDKSISTIGNDGFALYYAPTTKLVFRNLGIGLTTSASTIALNKLIYVSFVVDSGETGQFYINGVPSGASSTMTGLFADITTTNPLTIGNRAGATDRTFNGSIDEVRIWDTTLTQAQIQAEMVSTSPVVPTIASYSFNEHEGVTAYDTNHIVEGFDNTSKGMAFDGVDDYVSSTTSITSFPFTLTTWVNIDNTATDMTLIGLVDASSSATYYNIGLNNGVPDLTARNPSADILTATGGTISLNNWHMVTGVFTSNTNRTIYVDGVSKGTDTTSTTFNILVDTNLIGNLRLVSPVNYHNGSLDNIKIYNDSLTPTEVLDLYNNQYFDTSNLVASYDFEEMQNSLIHDRNRQVCVNCYSSEISYNNLLEGTYTTQVYDELSLTSNRAYFTIDITNPVITNNIPAEINSYAFNDSLFSCSDTNLLSCNIAIDSLTQDQNDNFTLVHNGNLSYTITAIDLAGNTINENGTLFVNPFQYFYFTRTNNTAITDFYFNNTLYTDYAFFPLYDLGLGSFNLSFDKLGFAVTNVPVTFNTTSTYNLTTNITASKILLSIYDRQTGNILTGLSTITLIATNGFNSTTTTGYLNISQVNFLAEQYQVIVSHDGYATESVYFDYDNQENLPVSIYLLNSTSTIYGTAIIELTADTGQLIQGAVCKALEWKPAQSAFVSVAEGLTNSNGQTTLNIELNTKLYKFSCEKDSNLVLSPQQVITTTGTTIPLEMSTTVTTDYNIFTTLTYSFTNTTYNSSHDTITFTWSENNGLVAQGCINIYNVKGTRKTLLSSNCATGSTSQKQVVTSINNSYNKQVEGVIIDVDGQSTKLGTIYYKSYYDLSRSLADYHLDIILPLLAVLIGIAIGLVLSPQNIYISQITVIILIWITAGLVPTVISGTIAVSVTMIAGLMLWGGFKVK